MKKMNFSLVRIGKILLPVFFIMGLFFLSTNNASAQTPDSKAFYEKVAQHVKSIPSSVDVILPTVKNSKEMANDPKIANEAKLFLERTYGELLLSYLDENQASKPDELIDRAYRVLNKKIPAEFLDKARKVYQNML